MAKFSLNELKDLIWQTYSRSKDEHEKLKQSFDVPWVDPPFPYPHTQEDVIAAKVSAGIADYHESRLELEWRLKSISYPYPNDNKRQHSFFDHVQGLRVLDLLLNPPLLDQIRWAWFILRTQTEEKKIDRKTSQHGYPLAFHREMLWQLARHLQWIAGMAKTHHVPEEWFQNYLPELRRQFLREASIYFPELRAWFQLGRLRRATRIRPMRKNREIQVELYREIDAALSTRGINNHKLARQLTSLICSRDTDIAKGKLDPTPDAVRTNLRSLRRSRRP